MAKKVLGRAPAPAPPAGKTKKSAPAARPAAGQVTRATQPARTELRNGSVARQAPTSTVSQRAARTAAAPQPVRSPVKAATPATTRRRVTARRMGFYNNERRRVGDVFMVAGNAFNPSWMTPVDGTVAIRRTTGKEELRRKHDELLQQKREGTLHTDEHDVPQGTDNPLDAD